MWEAGKACIGSYIVKKKPVKEKWGVKRHSWKRGVGK